MLATSKGGLRESKVGSEIAHMVRCGSPSHSHQLRLATVAILCLKKGELQRASVFPPELQGQEERGEKKGGEGKNHSS